MTTTRDLYISVVDKHPFLMVKKKAPSEHVALRFFGDGLLAEWYRTDTNSSLRDVENPEPLIESKWLHQLPGGACVERSLHGKYWSIRWAKGESVKSYPSLIEALAAFWLAYQ